jgi:Flp pilus assembly protein TadD
MEALDYPDLHHASAVEGWLDLDMPAEAAAQFVQLSTNARRHPSVLELQWRLQTVQLDWAGAVATARELMLLAPWLPNGWIHCSFALHELRRTTEALENLLQAEPRFPTNSIIPYNLACYACQLGDLSTARRWLRRAIELKGIDNLRSLAMDDPDLAPLWPEIASSDLGQSGPRS